MKAPYIVALALSAGLTGSLCLCQEGAKHEDKRHEEVNHARVAAVVLKACACAQECSKCPCQKPNKPQQAPERSEGMAQEETQVEEAQRCPCQKPNKPQQAPVRSEGVEAEETQTDSVKRTVSVEECACDQDCTKCPCKPPRPRSEDVAQEETQVEQADRCPCKPKPGRSVAVEQAETEVEAPAQAAE